MIFLCLFTFITSGVEHSIANMSVFGVALFSPGIKSVTIGAAVYNLIVVTLGNMAGGALVRGLGTYIMGSESNKTVSKVK